MQTIEIYQSLWAMNKDSPNDALYKIKEAGFDGVSLGLSIDLLESRLALKPLIEKLKLSCVVDIDVNSVEELPSLLASAKKLNAKQISLIIRKSPFKLEDAVKMVLIAIKDAETQNLPLVFETHRNGMLNDLHFTIQLMEMVPQMRLCCDLSHYIVEREIYPPFTKQNLDHISQIINQSDWFDCRVSTSEQIQVASDFPQHQYWLKMYKKWWKQGMEVWRKNSGANAILTFVCELGPPPYAITDVNQQELTDRWQEANQFRVWLKNTWDGLETQIFTKINYRL